LNNNKLAIVIPAYKDTYFRKSLLSLATQTNTDFTVYVGDDFSPYDLKTISNEFSENINIVYHRFATNLGSIDLVAQWERCVDIIKDEEWIWIFSDDDIAEPECVSSFYKALEDTNCYHDVYRFNTCIIDQNDNFIQAAVESPTIESAISLAYNILLWKRGNSMPDHIFKRSAYIKNGGVVNFIQAQASDWATSIKFAYNYGLYTINGPKVKWRNSGENISSLAFKNKIRLIYGHLQFIEWVTKKFQHSDETDEVRLIDVINASKYNLKEVIKSHYKGIPYSKIFSVAKKISAIYNESIFNTVIFCLKINFQLHRQN